MTKQHKIALSNHTRGNCWPPKEGSQPRYVQLSTNQPTKCRSTHSNGHWWSKISTNQFAKKMSKIEAIARKALYMYI